MIECTRESIRWTYERQPISASTITAAAPILYNHVMSDKPDNEKRKAIEALQTSCRTQAISKKIQATKDI